MQQWRVGKEQSGKRLQAFIKEQIGESASAKQIKHAIDAGRCLLNGKPERFASRLVGAGDIIKIEILQRTAASQTQGLGGKERILYSDEALVAYDKPPGISADSVELLKCLQQQFGPLILLHRLDKETTGILLFARNEAAAKCMESLFKKRLVKKKYLAIVSGVPAQPSGVQENFLGKLSTYAGQSIWGIVPSERGLFAKTTWEIAKRGNRMALLICYPETGRTHQIRVHLSSIGHPILGDHQYGYVAKGEERPPRVLLHAAEVAFEHPVNHRLVSIQAAVPEDFERIIKTLQ